MKPKFQNHFLVFLIFLSLIVFVDGYFRGWWDTHQYFVEARAWFHRNPPPLKMIQQDQSSTSGPAYLPPLTPYLWSFLYSENEKLNLISVRVLQVLLLVGTAILLLKKSTWPRPLVFILFVNPFTQELVKTPMSEPLSVFLLAIGYVLPSTRGVAAALQVFVRPGVVILHGLSLITGPSRILNTLAGLLVVLVFGYKTYPMVIPSSFAGAHFSLSKVGPLWLNFSEDFFRTFLFHLSGLALLAASAALALGLLYLLKRGVEKQRVLKKVGVLSSLIIYLGLLLVPEPINGVRYFFPLMVFLFLNLRWPEQKVSYRPWVKKFAGALVLVLCLHRVWQTGEHFSTLKRHDPPDSDSPSLIALKDWIYKNHLQNEVFLNLTSRHCQNFFQVECYGLTMKKEDWKKDLLERNIHFLLLYRLDWQQEAENKFLEDLKAKLGTSEDAIAQRTLIIGSSQVIDLRGLL